MSVKQRLEYIRGELRAERVSQGELFELQELAEHIAPGDVELLEAAGVPEPTPDNKFDVVGFIIAWESGELDKDAVIAGFQHLIDSGLAWRLQGWYGRQADALIEAGYCTPRQ